MAAPNVGWRIKSRTGDNSDQMTERVRRGRKIGPIMLRLERNHRTIKSMEKSWHLNLNEECEYENGGGKLYDLKTSL